MTSRLDYCDALLGGCPPSSINKLQIVQNVAAFLAGQENMIILLWNSLPDNVRGSDTLKYTLSFFCFG